MGDGSVKPIEEVQAGDEVLSCYGSGDFRPARVTRTQELARQRGVAITTAEGRQIVSTSEHTLFAGFKPGLTPQMHMTYLMRQGERFRVGKTCRITAARGQMRSASRPEHARSRQTARGSSRSMRPMPKHGSPNRCCPCATACRPCRSSPGSGRGQGPRADQAALDEIFDSVDSAGVDSTCSSIPLFAGLPASRCPGPRGRRATWSRSRCAPTDAARGHSTK